MSAVAALVHSRVPSQLERRRVGKDTSLSMYAPPALELKPAKSVLAASWVGRPDLTFEMVNKHSFSSHVRIMVLLHHQESDQRWMSMPHFFFSRADVGPSP